MALRVLGDCHNNKIIMILSISRMPEQINNNGINNFKSVITINNQYIYSVSRMSQQLVMTLKESVDCQNQ